MKTLSELYKELAKLPLGNIYLKNINGKDYYYHQYFLNGRSIINIVKKENVATLKERIKRRKEIEAQIKEIKSKQRNITLSKSAKELTGYVMSRNKVVATFDKGTLISINNKLAPLSIRRTHSLDEFLKLRVIDMSRTNARILRRILNIHVDDDHKAALYSYALSVSDNYWFKPKHSKLKYEEIKFKDDSYFDTALKGDTSPSVFMNQLTPEITTTGSFEKGWRYINKSWWLYKTGNNMQIFAELYSYHFAKVIELDTAIYEYADGYIRTKNFATKYNFEPLAALLGDNDEYNFVFNTLFKIDENIAKQYLKLIAFDAIIFNIDRHNENIGLLRDRKTGNIISLAPNFDNNLAFYTNNEIGLNMPQKDGMIKSFITFISNNENAKILFKQIQFKDIQEEDLYKILNQIEIKIDNEKLFVSALYMRYNFVKNTFNKEHI